MKKVIATLKNLKADLEVELNYAKSTNEDKNEILALEDEFQQFSKAIEILESNTSN